MSGPFFPGDLVTCRERTGAYLYSRLPELDDRGVPCGHHHDWSWRMPGPSSGLVLATVWVGNERRPWTLALWSCGVPGWTDPDALRRLLRVPCWSTARAFLSRNGQHPRKERSR